MTIEWTRRNILIGVLVVVAIVAILYLSWPARQPDNTQQIVNDAKKALEAQYTKQLKEKDLAVKDFQSRLTVSESKYKLIVRKYQDLQKEKENVKPPQTNAELRDRFVALGFPPVPVK
jgi:type VI protein secretion system component VasK